MNRRVWISVANLIAIGVAFVILFEYPQYSDDAFYVLLIWMVTGFVLLYAIRPRAAPLASGGSFGASPFPSTAPVAPAPAASAPPAAGLGFCIYCATMIAPGAQVCPACGHALPRW